MKCQILFSGKNKKNISKCRLLKILPTVLSVNPLWLVLPMSGTNLQGPNLRILELLTLVLLNPDMC